MVAKVAPMHITINGHTQEIPCGSSLACALALFSPYGDEACVVRLNGAVYKSIDALDDITLHSDDIIEIYPLVIGG